MFENDRRRRVLGTSDTSTKMEEEPGCCLIFHTNALNKGGHIDELRKLRKNAAAKYDRRDLRDFEMSFSNKSAPTKTLLSGVSSSMVSPTPVIETRPLWLLEPQYCRMAATRGPVYQGTSAGTLVEKCPLVSSLR